MTGKSSPRSLDMFDTMESDTSYLYKAPITVPERVVAAATRRRHEREYVYTLPKIETITERCIVGSLSFTLKRIKYVEKETLIHVGEGIFDTVTSVVRDWARFTYTGRVPRFDHATWVENERLVDDFKPQYALPGVYEDCVLVDLSSAYWHIARRVGYDCRFAQGRYLGVNSPIVDFPFSGHKVARGMLVSCALKGGLWWWDGCGSTSYQATYNPVYAPAFVALVYSVLHGVASDMRDMLLYYNVDGGIIRRRHLPIWEEVCASWGLPWKTKAAGYALVKGVGNYSVGSMRTKSLSSRNSHFDNLKPRNPWLRERFLRFAEWPDPS